MSRLIRFLSRRRTGRGVQKNKQDEQTHKPKKGYIVCKVLLLDGSDVGIDVPVSLIHTLQSTVNYLVILQFELCEKHKVSCRCQSKTFIQVG